ncbi:MAG: tail fiber domain-containing protein [Cytophagales bacterium]|nr:tail fiber domain-containing protein [Cytophagales bacterium]
MKNLTQLFLLGCFITVSLQTNAQTIGKPDGNTLNFFSTNSFGRLLGHRESGTFGNLGASDQWIGIGQPTISPGSIVKVPAYGLRAQWDGEAGIFSLKENGAIKDLAVEWGDNVNSKLRFSFIQDPTNPSALTEVMTMASDGKVGVGVTAPVAHFDVSSVTASSTNYGVRNTVDINTSTYGYGLYNSIGSGSSYVLSGIYNTMDDFSSYGAIVNDNRANGSGVYLYGVYSNITNTNAGFSTTYGIYGRATGNGTVWAGYFSGDVFVSGTLTHASDKKFKKDIKKVVKQEVASSFMKLKPATYNYKNSDQMKFTKGLQYGFVAQEVEEVFPDLVKNVVEPVFVTDANGNQVPSETEKIEFKSVNYTGLIPILTKIVQEHESTLAGYQMELDALKAENELLAERFGSLLSAIETGQMDQIRDLIEANKTSLGQNSPNPFGQETKINYTLGESVKEANLQIYDMQGALVGNYDLEKGKRSLDVSSNKLDPGVYVYVMVADGETIGTRRMIVTK